MTQDGSSSYIELCNLSLAYGSGDAQTLVFEGVNLSVRSGESVALIGPSGCGKTSILFALSGLLSPNAGHITVGGDVVEKPRRDVSLILQDAGLLPWKTVWQNAILSLKLAGDPTGHVMQQLQELDIAQLAHRYPSELSGGQRQRVGIARALAADPSLLLMDEPLASLDTYTKEHIQNLFLELWIKRRHTQVLVTHDLEEAVFLGQRIVVLSASPGGIRTVLDNPGMGTSDWRNSDAFYEQVIQLRKAFQ